jgi:hypothetical protein
MEQLEDRTVPSSFSAASVSDLIADINAANLAGGANSITLAPGALFTLTAADNTTDGGNGLPVIAANDNLTIIGNGDTIQRSGTPAFRLFDVASGASLALANLMLQGGWAQGPENGPGEGGAIYNQGTLDLNGVTVQNNIAQGGLSSFGAAVGTNGLGGGIYSSGALTMEGGTTLQNNYARGAMGNYYNRVAHPAGAGGNGEGGAVYVAAGTVSLTGVTLSGNTAQGGQGGSGNSYYPQGGNGGNGLGGGLYAAGGTDVTLHNDTVTGNTAQGGTGGSGSPAGKPGLGEGGGLFIDKGAVVYLDAFTQANVIDNTASSSDPNIHGHWKSG